MITIDWALTNDGKKITVLLDEEDEASVYFRDTDSHDDIGHKCEMLASIIAAIIRNRFLA